MVKKKNHPYRRSYPGAASDEDEDILISSDEEEQQQKDDQSISSRQPPPQRGRRRRGYLLNMPGRIANTTTTGKEQEARRSSIWKSLDNLDHHTTSESSWGDDSQQAAAAATTRPPVKRSSSLHSRITSTFSLRPKKTLSTKQKAQQQQQQTSSSNSSGYVSDSQVSRRSSLAPASAGTTTTTNKKKSPPPITTTQQQQQSQQLHQPQRYRRRGSVTQYSVDYDSDASCRSMPATLSSVVRRSAWEMSGSHRLPGDDEEEDEDIAAAARPSRMRSCSLRSSTSSAGAAGDGGDPQQEEALLGYEEHTPSVHNRPSQPRTSRRRGSVTRYSLDHVVSLSKKEEAPPVTTIRSQDEDMGYEEHLPTVGTTTPSNKPSRTSRRRGSVTRYSLDNLTTEVVGGTPSTTINSTIQHDNEDNNEDNNADLGYEDHAPSKPKKINKKRTSRRRGSVTRYSLDNSTSIPVSTADDTAATDLGYEDHGPSRSSSSSGVARSTSRRRGSVTRYSLDNVTVSTVSSTIITTDDEDDDADADSDDGDETPKTPKKPQQQQPSRVSRRRGSVLTFSLDNVSDATTGNNGTFSLDNVSDASTTTTRNNNHKISTSTPATASTTSTPPLSSSAVFNPSQGKRATGRGRYDTNVDDDSVRDDDDDASVVSMPPTTPASANSNSITTPRTRAPRRGGFALNAAIPSTLPYATPASIPLVATTSSASYPTNADQDGDSTSQKDPQPGDDNYSTNLQDSGRYGRRSISISDDEDNDHAEDEVKKKPALPSMLIRKLSKTMDSSGHARRRWSNDKQPPVSEGFESNTSVSALRRWSNGKQVISVDSSQPTLIGHSWHAGRRRSNEKQPLSTASSSIKSHPLENNSGHVRKLSSSPSKALKKQPLEEDSGHIRKPWYQRQVHDQQQQGTDDEDSDVNDSSDDEFAGESASTKPTAATKGGTYTHKRISNLKKRNNSNALSKILGRVDDHLTGGMTTKLRRPSDTQSTVSNTSTTSSSTDSATNNTAASSPPSKSIKASSRFRQRRGSMVMASPPETPIQESPVKAVRAPKEIPPAVLSPSARPPPIKSCLKIPKEFHGSWAAMNIDQEKSVQFGSLRILEFPIILGE